jgi:phage gpG-like protein
MDESGVEVTGIEELTVGFSRFAEDIQDASEAFRLMAADFHELERRQFESEGKYGSGGWPALSPRYAAWKAANYPGRKILVLSGLLKESLTDGNPWTVEEIEPTQMLIGTNIPYSLHHQLGGERVPQRKPVVLTEADQQRWIKIFHAWLVKRSNSAFAGLMPGMNAAARHLKSIQQET